MHELPDEEPPGGVTTCLAQLGTCLAAGNTDAHSQLRMWDLRSAGAALRDRFNLPAYCKGVRCIAALGEHAPNELVAGTTNGWALRFDVRTGRYERVYSHAECVSAIVAQGRTLVSTGDDKLVRVMDARHSFAPLSSHRVRSTIYSAACDDESIFLGVGDGDVRCLDFSAASNAHTDTEGCGGFDSRQKAALTAALESAHRKQRNAATASRF